MSALTPPTTILLDEPIKMKKLHGWKNIRIPVMDGRYLPTNIRT